MNQTDLFSNPFRPGANHPPPHLAGRSDELDQFQKLLKQEVISDNVIVSGLRGVGKTSLLVSFEPIARKAGWLWTGDDLTESSTLSELTVAERLITDLSLTLAPIFMQTQIEMPLGFTGKAKKNKKPVGYQDLKQIFDDTPGLVSDKLKAVLRFVGTLIGSTNIEGIVFAYDEAQNLADRADEGEYPFSLLLDVFQSVQRPPGGLKFILVLTGLPTLFPKLNETRTYTERMFEMMVLDSLEPDEAKEAIVKPVSEANCQVSFSDHTVDTIAEMSGGYPYFIQFICKEVFDVWIMRMGAGQDPSIPVDAIIKKLDQRFFSPRWDNATDRQREFMLCAAILKNSKTEFTVQQIVESSKQQNITKKFTISSAGMMMGKLVDADFMYRNRRGKYAFAVPMFDEFILRQST